jgi:signal transduction histidine kinase
MVLAFVLVAAASVYFFRRVVANEAIRDARVVTATIAHGTIEPALHRGLVEGDPDALAVLDDSIRRYVLSGDVVRVKLWTAGGRIVYSDEPRLIGRSYRLDEEELHAIRTGQTAANVSDLSAPENGYERQFGKLLQVYQRVRTPDGQPLLFETYQRYRSVSARSYDLFVTFLPVLLGALALLAVVQLSLAWSLARRLRAGQQERERLLVQAIQASNLERRRIAADLHDTVVQDMTGISLSLAAAAGEPGRLDDEAVRSLLQRTAASTRHVIRRLRSLLVDIYPPNLQAEGLAAALSDLVEPLTERGLATTLDAPDALRLSPAAEQVVFRSAQEALRNVAEHAGAHAVSVSLSADDGAGTATLVVEDDGRGFTPGDAAARQAGGHFGLTLLADAAADLGGRLDVASAPGQGTRVTLEVPST